MTRREQLFLFWTLAVLSVGGMLAWLSMEVTSAEMSFAGVKLGHFMGGLLFVAGGLFVIVLVLATILMPLYVMSLHGLMKRMVKLAEENAKRIELMHLHLAQLKKRWLDGE